MRRRIVIAPDSFKGTLSATDAALAIARGWQSERPHDEVLLVPQADGGEGTLDAIAQASPGAQWRNVRVAGPTGEPHDARWLLLTGEHAVLELAECCGLTLLPRSPVRELALAPLTASTRGLGEAIAAALGAGARRRGPARRARRRHHPADRHVRRAHGPHGGSRGVRSAKGRER